MSDKRISSFQEFWPFYLNEHSKKLTRTYHFIGTSLSLVFLVTYLVTFNGLFLLIALFSGYGFAWISHFTIEKNRPATFKYPFWSLISDWKMWSYTLTGKLESELQKYKIHN